jgi:hypothetical protein
LPNALVFSRWLESMMAASAALPEFGRFNEPGAQFKASARLRSHADTRGNASQDDLGHAALAQVVMQRRAKKGTPTLLGDDRQCLHVG